MRRNLENKLATHGTEPLELREGKWVNKNMKKSSGDALVMKTEIWFWLAFWVGSWLFHVLLLLSKRPNIICKHYALKKIMLKLPETQNITLTTSFTNAL